LADLASRQDQMQSDQRELIKHVGDLAAGQQEILRLLRGGQSPTRND
jgi:hypothetical protein